MINKKCLELGEKGAFEDLVGWAGKDTDGHVCAESWEPEKLITVDVRAQFESKLVKASVQEVTVDMGPLINAVRDSIARAVLLAKTAIRPMEHCLILDAFSVHRAGSGPRPARSSAAPNGFCMAARADARAQHGDRRRG